MNPLKQLRKQRGWTQKDVVRQINYSMSWYGPIERHSGGFGWIKLGHIKVFAELYDMPTGVLAAILSDEHMDPRSIRQIYEEKVENRGGFEL